LEAGDRTAADVVARIYVDLIDELVPRAEQTVHAHLRKLEGDGRVRTKDADDPKSEWELSP
jgi:hypothetical protein